MTRRSLPPYLKDSLPGLRGWPLAFAHRGADSARENTLAAFRAATARGCGYLELDVRTAKDGVLMVFHDEVLDRVTTGAGKISDHTWEDLTRFRVIDPALAAKAEATGRARPETPEHARAAAPDRAGSAGRGRLETGAVGAAQCGSGNEAAGVGAMPGTAGDEVTDAGAMHSEHSGGGSAVGVMQGEHSGAGSTVGTYDEGEHLLRFEDLLTEWDDVRLNVDLKDDAAAEAIAQIIARHDAWDRVLVASFHDSRRRRFTRAAGRRVAMSGGAFAIGVLVLAASLGLTRFVARQLVHIHCVQVPVRYGPVRVVTPAFIARCQAAGLQVHVWVVDDPAEMERLLDMGVDGLMTDDLEALATVLEGRGHWPQR